MESLNLLRYLVLRDNILRNAVSHTNLTPTVILATILVTAVLPDPLRQGCGEKYAGSKTNILQHYVCASAYQEAIIVQK